MCTVTKFVSLGPSVRIWQRANYKDYTVMYNSDHRKCLHIGYRVLIPFHYLVSEFDYGGKSPVHPIQCVQIGLP